MPEKTYPDTTMARCRHCTALNPIDEDACYRCGHQFRRNQPDAETVRIQDELTQYLDMDQPRPADERGTATLKSESLVRFTFDGDFDPVIVNLPDGRDLSVGRGDTESSIHPDMDLNQFHGHRKGVSRRHAQLRRINKNLYLMDLGSANGTFINGDQLSPGQLYKLHDGDKVRMGYLLMWLDF